MNAKKETVKTGNDNSYPLSFLNSSKLSGSALKVTTAKNNGEYPLTFKETGTGKVLGTIFSIVSKNPTDKILPERILEGFEIVEKDNFSTKYGKVFSSNLPKGYGNYKTLKTRILGEIKKGAIKFFIPVNTPESFYNNIKKSISA